MPYAKPLDILKLTTLEKLFSSWMTVVMVREVQIATGHSETISSHWNSLPLHVVNADTVLTFKKMPS